MTDHTSAVIVSDRMTPAQERALVELAGSDGFVRTSQGWKTPNGRFVPLIVVAKLRKAKLAALTRDKRRAVITESGRSAVHAR
ncbi:MAG: hypothetical protein ACREPQ_00725 [Rhodanobacter sp.]